MRRAALSLLVFAILLPGCSALTGSSAPKAYHADFNRAVQVFPGVKVRVLGVTVGLVMDVNNTPSAAQVTFKLTDPTVKLPANVRAAVVPMSLLGERYIQLFPSYQGGPTLRPGATIPLSRTAVPAEPDELLRSLQDYLGGIDPAVVTTFVANASAVLQGNGADLNRLIQHAASVFSTLSAKRDDLATLIVELNKLTQALASRQQALGELIRNYNAVASTLTTNRSALEGTISGLNDASVQLASLLLDHRLPLQTDIANLTRTGRTLSRNADALAQTGQWATKLFLAASRATDYNRDWLRLGNQGQELAALITLRLEQRLMQLCQAVGAKQCAAPSYWAIHVPNLFCFAVRCPTTGATPGVALTRALQGMKSVNIVLEKQARGSGTTVPDMIQNLLDQTIGNPFGLGGLL